MLSDFKANILKSQLFSNQSRLLLAVSGGIDSMVLADLLLRSGYQFSVAHCNFLLRSDESEGDEKFVEEFCRKNSISFYTKKMGARKYADERRLSVQMAARELRYNWFRELLSQHKLDYILTAHHLDDNIETFFINLLRGSGINGLKGIEKKKGVFVRPLLEFSKETILNYAYEKKIEYREDSSNREEKYLRNHLRLSIIPKLKEINPGFENTFRNELKHLSDANEIVSAYVAEAKERLVETGKEIVKINIPLLMRIKASSLVLFELLKEYGFHPDNVRQIEQALSSEPGKLFYSESHELLKDRNHLVIRKRVFTDEVEEISIEQNSTEIHSPLKMSFRISDSCDLSSLKDNETVLDAGLLSFPLQLSKWKQGEKFRPLGMSGFKKLSDFFADQKMSAFEKQNQWILRSEDKIVWVVGKRIDERFKVTSVTEKYLIIRLQS